MRHVLLPLVLFGSSLGAIAQGAPPAGRCVTSVTELNLGLVPVITRADINVAAVGGVVGTWSTLVNPEVFRCNGQQSSVLRPMPLQPTGMLVTSPDGATANVYRTTVGGIGLAVVVRDPRRGWISLSPEERVLAGPAAFSSLGIQLRAAYVKIAAVVGHGTIRTVPAEFFTRNDSQQETSTRLPLVAGGTNVLPEVVKTCRTDNQNFDLGMHRASDIQAVGSRTPVRSFTVTSVCDNQDAVPIHYIVTPVNPLGLPCDGLLGNSAEAGGGGGSSNVGVYLSWKINAAPTTCVNVEESVAPANRSGETNSVVRMEFYAGIVQLTGRGYVGPVRGTVLLSAYYR